MRLRVVMTVVAFLSAIAIEDPSKAQSAGQWSSTTALPNIPISAAILPNNSILSWSSNNLTTFELDIGSGRSQTYTSLYSLLTNKVTSTIESATMADMFCSGIAFLPDGRLMVVGGSSSSHTELYDYTARTWSAASPLGIARGYNSAVTLSTGNIFTIGGSWSGSGLPKDGELWSPSTGWEPTGISVDTVLAKDIGDAALGYVLYGDNHPWLFAMPNGTVFHAGPSPQMNWFDPDKGTAVSAGTRGDDAYSVNGIAGNGTARQDF